MLTGSHHVQVVVDSDVEFLQKRRRQIGVLRGADIYRGQIWPAIDLLKDRGELDDLRSRPEDTHHLLGRQGAG